MTENTFFKDWTALQDDIEAVAKSEDNPFFHSKYTPLKVLIPIIKEKCKKHNFILYQFPSISQSSVGLESVLKTIIKHVSGEEISGEVRLVSKDDKDPQKLGSAMTYMRRYSIACMFNIVEPDDDANCASGKTQLVEFEPFGNPTPKFK